MDPTFAEIYSALACILQDRYSQKFTVTEKAILEATWNGETYAALAVELSIDPGALRAQHGVQTWNKVAKIYGLSQIKKKDFKGLAIQYYKGADVKSIENNSIISDVKVLGGQLPKNKEFFGRKIEKISINASLIHSQCILLYGPPGIGKTALAINAVDEIFCNNNETKFTACVWRSLQHRPEFNTFLIELLHICGETSMDRSYTTDALLSIFIELIKNNRYLFIIDGINNVVLGDCRNKRPDQKGSNYVDFLLQISQEQHQSCFLVTSQESIKILRLLEDDGYPVARYKIGSLGKASIRILQKRGIDTGSNIDQLINTYRGNPGMIILMSSLIRDFFKGDADGYIANNSTIGLDVYNTRILDRLQQLSDIESEILLYVSSSGTCTVQAVKEHFKEESSVAIFEAIYKLQDNSLLEENKEKSMLSVEPALKRVVLGNLTDCQIKATQLVES